MQHHEPSPRAVQGGRRLVLSCATAVAMYVGLAFALVGASASTQGPEKPDDVVQQVAIVRPARQRAVSGSPASRVQARPPELGASQPKRRRVRRPREATSAMPAAPEPEPDLPGQTGADPEAEPGGAAEGVEAGPLQGPADGPGAAPLPAPAPPPLPPRPPVPKAGNPVPDYPRAARRQGIEGVVVAKILVRADGTVAKVWILSGPEIFHEAVTEALRSYRYEPARLASGTAIAAHHTVSFPFALAQTR